MEVWVSVLAAVCALVFFITSLHYKSKRNPIPPGPPHIPIITPILWFRKSFAELEPILRRLHAQYGPILTLRIASRPSIFISDRFIAHQALIQKGSLFSDRPKALPTNKIVSSDQHNISSAPYGPTWRLLRRNLTSEILHHSRVKSFSTVRKRVLDTLITRLKSDAEESSSIRVIDHLQYAMFCLLVFMCFGEGVDHHQIKEIERVQRRFLLSFSRFNILNFCPPITRILFRKRWEEFFQLRKEQEAVLVPLIRDRKKAKENQLDGNSVVSYVDTLFDLELPKEEENRKLHEGEMVTLCSEFLNAGTDTTSTALQWIMANLVKYPHVQQRLVEEIGKVMTGAGRGGEEKEEVKEEYLQELPYLKAVVLEGLRRHPPGHFVLPHSVTEEDVVLNGYLVPKNGVVNFMVAEMGWDPKVWEDPMEFKPERFLNYDQSQLEPFDITGTKEIRMMPFGAGRRICPGYNLAMLHLEYFVANLVWNFDWKVPKGGSVDLSEKQEFTMVMKNALQAHISPRI